MTKEAPSGKRSPDLTKVILTLIGIAGLGLFILACRPSWSPDGRKVVYSYGDERAQESAVAVFDRKTRTSRAIFELSRETKSSTAIVVAQWAKDGAHVIVAFPGGGGQMSVLALPQNAQKSVRAFTVEHTEDSDNLAFVPFPQVGNQLFVGGAKGRSRINLETGEIYTYQEKEKNECILYEAGDKILYLRPIETQQAGANKEVAAKKETEEQKKQGEETAAYEFGELDPKDLSLHPAVTLKTEELKSRGIGEPSGFLDVNPRNQIIAATEDPLDGKEPRILLIGKSGIEQALDVGIKGKSYKLGNPEWSRDGKVIFVSALIEDEKTKKTEFAVVEVPVDGKSSRIDQIEVRPKDEMDSDYLSYVQIALSPDGRMIAAATGHLEQVRPERKGLFLLDLSNADRPVSFYPAPALPALPKKE